MAGALAVNSGSTVAAAWVTYSSHRGLFFGISMWVALIAVVSSLIQQLIAGEPMSATSAPQATPLGGIAVLISGVMLGVVILFSQSATAHAWAAIRSGQQVTARQCYQLAVPRVPALVGTALLAAAAYIILGLSVYLAPLALLLAVIWALVVPVVQLEGASGAGALVRSWRLVRHQLLKQAELTSHLGYEKGDPAASAVSNSRNGATPKKVATQTGDVELAIPRDRDGTFTPTLVPKGSRRLSGLDEMIISLYAGGMTVRDIAPPGFDDRDRAEPGIPREPRWSKSRRTTTPRSAAATHASKSGPVTSSQAVM